MQWDAENIVEKIMYERQFTVIGPVLSGKTTYFAALYYLLKNAETQYPFRLDPQYDIQDRTYLNEISQKWARLEEIDHTVTKFWSKLELPLLSIEGNKRLKVLVPDLAGEFFQESLETRIWDYDFANQLSLSDGIMLFINVTDYREVVSLVGTPLSANDTEVAGPNIEEGELVPWAADIQKLPSDVTYTDLIQQVYYHNQEQKYQLSIVLSAWDIIKNSITKGGRDFYNHPERYFRKRFPLLSQFLDSHEDSFDLKVFGISGYGCDPMNPEEREQLEDVEPFERVQIVGPNGFSHDITLPLLITM